MIYEIFKKIYSKYRKNIVYFLPIFISFIRELGGSLMLLHMNVRGIEKNTHKEEYA